MNDLWFAFDPLDADERAEQQALEAEIATAERAALDAIRSLTDLIDRNGYPAEIAGRSALTHISTIAQAESQRLFRLSIDRQERHRQKVSGN